MTRGSLRLDSIFGINVVLLSALSVAFTSTLRTKTCRGDPAKHPTDGDLSVGTPQRKKPLECEASVHSNSENAIAPGRQPDPGANQPIVARICPRWPGILRPRAFRPLWLQSPRRLRLQIFSITPERQLQPPKASKTTRLNEFFSEGGNPSPLAMNQRVEFSPWRSLRDGLICY